MASLTRLLGTVLRSLASSLSTRQAPSRQTPRGSTSSRSSPTGARNGSVGTSTASRPAPLPTDATRTVEIDSRTLGQQQLSYTPRPDSRPDPGEVVWTWVPYEENDGRGKDRPVLVLARLSANTVLGIQLTSKTHEGDRGALELGPGPWDSSGRSSWARLDRLFRVNDAGMRREGAALDARRYDLVARALKERYRF